MLNRKYQCNGFMTDWANWGCGKGRVGLSQTESDGVRITLLHR